MKVNSEHITELIGRIGYEILDDIVGPAIGSSGIVADLYLADVSVYSLTEKEEEAVLTAYTKKYGITTMEWSYFVGMPIALLALYVLENTNYLETHE